MNLASFAIFKKEKQIRDTNLLEEVNPMGRKWANIVAKKTAKDGANSKVYAKFGVEIYVAAKQGEPDPESNSALKFVLERAKQAQVPKHVIDKAIDKAKGNTDDYRRYFDFKR